MSGVPMLTQVKHWLAEPAFVDDDEKRLEAFLDALLISILILSPLSLFLLFAFGYHDHQEHVQLILGIMGLAIAARIALRRRPVRAVSWLLLTGAWFLAIVTVFHQGGAIGPLYSFYGIVVLAPFAVGRGFGIGFASLSAIVSALLILMAEYTTWLPESDQYEPVLNWVYFSATLIFVALVFEMMAASLRESLAEARQTSERLRVANDFHCLITDLALDFINVVPDQVDSEMRRLLKRLAEFVGADISLVMGLSEDGQTGSCLHEWHRSTVVPSLFAQLQQLAVADFPWIMHQLCDMKNISIPSLKSLPPEAAGVRQFMLDLGLHGGMIVPLVRRGELAGFVGYGMAEPDCECTPEAMALLRVAGEVIVNALDRKRGERHRLEIALERERVETLQLFISNVSHDLKTPLTVIKSNLFLAEQGDDGARRTEHLNNIGAQVDRIDHLLLDLLTLLRLDSSPEFDFQPLDVCAVLGDVEAQLRPLAEEKQLALTIQTEAGLGEVLADRRQLARVFVNLLQNAISYTSAGQIISIQAYQQADSVIIEVTDTGIGISPNDLPRIFEQFYRAPAAKALASNGTGLGLSIVSRIIQMHGGTVTVDSVEDCGSTFRVSLPVVSLKL